MTKTRKIFLYSAGGIVLLLLLGIGSMEYTSRSEFCNTCHYMEPFYQAWKHSSHNNVACIQCHYPPGILSTFEGKVKGLEQLFKYATQSYRRSKPWAEIPDASCLREGCHEARLLEGKVKFKENITFDHTPHLTQLRRGKQLRCTSCHSQIVQGEHISVTETTCFLCHFKGLEDEIAPAKCTSCHDAPVATPERQVSYDHTQVREHNISCMKCHGQMVVGDGAVPMENCMNCHFEKERLARYSDTTFVHLNHITKHKIECQQCHLAIQHKSVSRSAAVKPDCNACHPDYHKVQEELFLGTGGYGVENNPSPMFEGGLNCQACHIFHKDLGGFQPAGETFVARGESCEPCHGKGYGKLLEAWRISTDERLKSIDVSARIVERELVRADTTRGRGKAGRELYNKALYNYHMVEFGKGVHNITYTDRLLQAAHSMLGQALEAAGSPARLTAYKWSSQLAPSECANCHEQNVEKDTVQVFGLEFNHRRHLEKAGIDNCKTCHSNMRRHGEMVLERNDCLNCHHKAERTAQENCAPCHESQNAVYTGTAFGAGTPDPMQEAEVTCQQCHLNEDQAVVRPEGKACLTCHDEGYDKMLAEWQSENAEKLQNIEKLLDRADSAGVSTANRGRVASLRAMADLLEQDGSRGAHNSALYQEYLDRIGTQLSELVPYR